MRAMIFAAGMGTRLRPITETMPKALVEVAGVPMIDRAISRLREVGVDLIVVNVHHHADILCRHLQRYENVVISDERDCLLDTGGGVLAAREFFEDAEPVILYNADILTDFSLTEMVGRHLSSGAVATLLVDPARDSSRKLLFDETGLMRGWMNENTGEIRPDKLDLSGLSKMAFGGVHVVSPDIFSALECYSAKFGRVFSITSFYVDICRVAPIAGYTPLREYQWFDIGSVQKLESANKYFTE